MMRRHHIFKIIASIMSVIIVVIVETLLALT
jgi:hypothetical protein